MPLKVQFNGEDVYEVDVDAQYVDKVTISSGAGTEYVPLPLSSDTVNLGVVLRSPTDLEIVSGKAVDAKAKAEEEFYKSVQNVLPKPAEEEAPAPTKKASLTSSKS